MCLFIIGNNTTENYALSQGVQNNSLVFLRLLHPIQWDDDEVQMVFGIAVRKENSGNEHLKILSNLARKLMNKVFTDELLHSVNQSSCLKLLEENSIQRQI